MRSLSTTLPRNFETLHACGKPDHPAMYLQIILLHYLGTLKPASGRSGPEMAFRRSEPNQERSGVRLQKPRQKFQAKPGTPTSTSLTPHPSQGTLKAAFTNPSRVRENLFQR